MRDQFSNYFFKCNLKKKLGKEMIKPAYDIIIP